jgi:integrase
MGRIRKGSIVERKGKLYACVQFVDETGCKRGIWRKADTRKQARETIKQVLRELDENGAATFDAQNMTFAELANYFRQHYMKPAEYTTEGRKLAGYRSLSSFQAFLKPLKAAFDKKRLRGITYGEIRSYKAMRLRVPTQYERARSLACVHRELALLRRLLNIALREGWILKNPFAAGETLISIADERKRERILTQEEEARLLAACDSHSRRTPLRALLICALDTGMRKGEMLKLCWKDLDFKSRTINIRAMNTKTMRARQVAMTARLYLEFEQLWGSSEKHNDGLVFGVKTNVRKSLDAACKDAGIVGFTLHCARHTAATRLVKGQMPLHMVGRILGHSQPQTTYRYLSADLDTAKQAAAILEALQPTSIEQSTVITSGLVN